MSGDGTSTITDIHDIKPLLEIGPDLVWLWWVLGACLLLGGILLGVWLWRRRRSGETAVPVTPPIPADVEALAHLDTLAVDGRAKPFYFRLSEILRHYIERCYAFPAGEMTTEELTPHLLQFPLASQVKDLCRRADLVKFADYPGHQGQMHNDKALVLDFVAQTTDLQKANDLDTFNGAGDAVTTDTVRQ